MVEGAAKQRRGIPPHHSIERGARPSDDVRGVGVPTKARKAGATISGADLRDPNKMSLERSKNKKTLRLQWCAADCDSVYCTWILKDPLMMTSSAWDRVRCINQSDSFVEDLHCSPVVWHAFS
ncbi:hypothetical protein FKM82_015570 [Ascaphus truei]